MLASFLSHAIHRICVSHSSVYLYYLIFTCVRINVIYLQFTEIHARFHKSFHNRLHHHHHRSDQEKEAMQYQSGVGLRVIILIQRILSILNILNVYSTYIFVLTSDFKFCLDGFIYEVANKEHIRIHENIFSIACDETLEFGVFYLSLI